MNAINFPAWRAIWVSKGQEKVHVVSFWFYFAARTVARERFAIEIHEPAALICRSLLNLFKTKKKGKRKTHQQLVWNEHFRYSEGVSFCLARFELILTVYASNSNRLTSRQLIEYYFLRGRGMLPVIKMGYLANYGAPERLQIMFAIRLPRALEMGFGSSLTHCTEDSSPWRRYSNRGSFAELK